MLIDTASIIRRLTSKDFVIRLSSRNAWQHYLQMSVVTDESQGALSLQVIDKLEREKPAVNQEKLSKLGFSYDEITSFY